MLSPATTAEPRPVYERQIRVERPASGAELRRWEEASDPDAALEAPGGLVLDLTHELAEGSVEDRTGQLGFRKPLRVQILDADQIFDARRRFILSAKAGGFLASK